MNSVVLVGRIIADPELRTTASNLPVVSFTLAVDKRGANRQEGGQTADFINCVAWRANATNMANYVKKGNKLCVKGSISTRTYTAQDGNKRYVVEVVADEVEFMTLRARDDQASGQQLPAPDPFADNAGSDYAPFEKQETKDDFDPFAED